MSLEYNHILTPVTTGGPCTVLYDQQIHRDRTVPANKPDIILRHNAEKLCKLIEVSVPAEINTRQPRTSQKVEIARMWGIKSKTFPVIVGAALGAKPHSM